MLMLENAQEAPSDATSLVKHSLLRLALFSREPLSFNDLIAIHLRCHDLPHRGCNVYGLEPLQG